MLLFEVLFELTRCPEGPSTLRVASCEQQRNKHTVRYGALGAEVPGHRQEPLTQTSTVALVFIDPKI